MTLTHMDTQPALMSCSVAAEVMSRSCKDYSSVSQYQNQGSNPYHPVARRDIDFDESFDEEVDEEFSDEDCEMADEDSGDKSESPASNNGNTTSQLLQFADMVNKDIQKYFGARKGDEDSCNIYEDRWKNARSGRERYYSDLMKIAQGIDTDLDSEDKVTSTTGEDPNTPPPSGKMDKKAGLGPLVELFQFGLKDYWEDKKLAQKLKKVKKFKPDNLSKLSEKQLPLLKRQLPESFWKEPIESQNGAKEPNKGGSNQILTSSKTPDFSDLLESWTGDGDMSSSDLATPSPQQPAVQQPRGTS